MLQAYTPSVAHFPMRRALLSSRQRCEGDLRLTAEV